MIEGRRVYDPLTNTWSTGYWIPIHNATGRIELYLPVWSECERNHEKERSQHGE